VTPPDGAATCYDCLKYSTAAATTFAIDAPHFGYFPFDRHNFSFTYAVADSELFSCGSLLSRLNLTSEAALAGLIGGEWIGEKILAQHPRPPLGSASETEDVGACEVVLTVRRNMQIFLIKQIMPTVVVVYASLMSLYLTANDHTGDRTGMILVGALILIVNFQFDQGLGNITYLVWWDIFNLVQMLMLLGVLIIALYEHRLVAAGNEANADSFNKVFRIAFLYMVYPVILLGLYLYGRSQSSPGLAAFAWVLIILGSSGILMMAAVIHRGVLHADEWRRTRAARLLSGADPSSASFAKALKACFNAFDGNSDGMLSQDELRSMLKAAFGSHAPTELNDFIKEMMEHANEGGLFALHSFGDVITPMMPALKAMGNTTSPNAAPVHAPAAAMMSVLSKPGHMLAAMPLRMHTRKAAKGVSV